MNTKSPQYMTRMEACSTLEELRSIGLAMLIDESMAQPRHQMATYASIYRDNFSRIVDNTK
jgi:hypothetical protein